MLILDLTGFRLGRTTEYNHIGKKIVRLEITPNNVGDPHFLQDVQNTENG